MDNQKSLVGKIFTEKHLCPKKLKANILQLWNPNANMYMVMLSEHIFMFTFDDRHDLDTVSRGSPWFLGGKLLILSTLEPNKPVNLHVFDKVSVWIRASGFDERFMSERVATLVGNYIGKYECVDTLWDVSTNESMRMKVSIDVDERLPSTVYISINHLFKIIVHVNYVEIGELCERCSRLGHLEPWCPYMDRKEVPKQTQYAIAEEINGEVMMCGQTTRYNFPSGFPRIYYSGFSDENPYKKMDPKNNTYVVLGSTSMSPK